jgi:hypothetical protein
VIDRRALAVGAASLVVLAAGLVGAGAASAADQIPAESSFGGTFWLADANTLSDFEAGQSVGWDQPATALPKAGDTENRLIAPPGTQSVVTFVAPQGSEADPSTWHATAPWELTPPGQWLADVTPYHLIVPGPGNPSGTNALAHAGGDYSLGVAYLKDGGQRVVDGGLFFVHIHLTGNADPEKASYTWQPVEASGTATAAPTPASSSAPGSVAGGLLSLTSSATPPDGSLGTVTVDDGRTSSAPGWTLVVSASAPSADGTPVGLGLAPALVGGPGVVLGTPRAAGSSPAPRTFATTPAGTAGRAQLGAALTFPAAPAGTVTVTLVSG